MKVLIAVLALAACAAAVPAEDQPEDIGSPLTVAQCRAQCLQRVSKGHTVVVHSIGTTIQRNDNIRKPLVLNDSLDSGYHTHYYSYSKLKR